MLTARPAVLAPQEVDEIRQNGCMFESTVTTAVNTAELRKIRGAFFLPNAITRYVTDWSVKTAHATVLEPSSGDATFLVRAVRRSCEPYVAHARQWMQLYGIGL